MNQFPTIEEYGEMAKGIARKLLDEEDQQEVERFLKSQDTADIIEDSYENFKHKYEDSGKLKVAVHSGVNAAAYNLYMCF